LLKAIFGKTADCLRIFPRQALFAGAPFFWRPDDLSRSHNLFIWVSQQCTIVQHTVTVFRTVKIDCLHRQDRDRSLAHRSIMWWSWLRARAGDRLFFGARRHPTVRC